MEKSLDVTIVTTDNGRNLNIELEFFEFAKSDIKKGQCHLGHIPTFLLAARAPVARVGAVPWIWQVGGSY